MGREVQGLVNGFDEPGFPMSRAVRPRRPLGQPVMRGSVLVVGRRGGTGGTS